jgi:RNA polymerase sigma factor (TIGR02999 family)
MSEVAQILALLEEGDVQTSSELLPLLYDELRRLAAAKIAQELPGQTLQATALVHEAYLRIVGSDREVCWSNKGHFFAAAAEAMRRILVENARRKSSLKRGGGLRRLDIDLEGASRPQNPEELLALNEALESLAAEDPLKAELVKLRCFAGLSQQEAAATLGLSRATATRYWAYARTRLYYEIYGAPDDEEI